MKAVPACITIAKCLKTMSQVDKVLVSETEYTKPFGRLLVIFTECLSVLAFLKVLNTPEYPLSQSEALLRDSIRGF